MTFKILKNFMSSANNEVEDKIKKEITGAVEKARRNNVHPHHV